MSNWTADDGTKINFEIYGGQDKEKPALLLLPGLLGTIQNQWRKFIDPLSKDFRIVVMDLRGHGRSTNQSDSLHLERMMQDIIGLLDFLEMPIIHISGYSLGGYLGLMLALQQPRRVASLLMHATKFYWTTDAVQKMQDQLNPEAMAEKVPTYANQLMQEHGARQWRELVRQAAMLLQQMREEGLKEQMLANFQCPVLISVGDGDQLLPLLEAQRISRIIKNGSLIVLPNVRHPFQTIKMMPLLPMMQHFHLEYA